MISIDDHRPPPDPSSSDYHNLQHQVSHDLKIDNGERTHTSVSDIDLLKPTDSNLDDTNNRLPNFSIRDYVFDSRCKGINCNWPFSGESLQVCLNYGVENFLPPFQSLDSLRSNSNEETMISTFNGRSKDDRLESQCHAEEDLAQTKPRKSHPAAHFIVSETMASKVCPVCKTFSSSSNTTLNAHIDQCLSVESTTKWTAVNPTITVRHTVKPRKTRLIVDIYKTAPRCTVEELDRRNGRTSFLDQNFEKEEPAFTPDVIDQEGAVYIDTNGTKIRILSMLKVGTEAQKLQKGSKIVSEKKKKKVYVQKRPQKSLKLSTNSKRLRSPNAHHHGVFKARNGQEENVGIARSCGKEEILATWPPWACSKRSVLRKKFNGKNGMLHSGSGEFLGESDESSDNMSSLQYNKKARTQLSKGIKYASLKPTTSQEYTLGSRINLQREILFLKKSHENDDQFQDSFERKSRMEEEEDASKNSSFDIENGLEVNKKDSITSKSSNRDSLESTRTEILYHSNHVQGSFMGLRNPLDVEFLKLVNRPDNKFDLQESNMICHNIEYHMGDIEKQGNYFEEVDPIPIPSPPGSFLPPSPGGDMISEELQANSSLTTTSRAHANENHHYRHHDMLNKDLMSDSPISAISSPCFSRSDGKLSVRFSSLQDTNLGYTSVMVDQKKSAPIASSSTFQNDQPCCSREGVYSENVASYPREHVRSSSMNLLPPSETVKWPVDPSIKYPSTPVLRLMGKNLTVVNTNDEHFKAHSPCSSSINHHQQLHNIQHHHTSFFHCYPSQLPITFNHNQNGSNPQLNSRNLADFRHIHAFDTKFSSTYGSVAPADFHRLDRY